MKKHCQQGISNLLMMIFLAFLATLVIVVIQSRLLLAIERNKSLSDILLAQYASESQINDILKRVLTYGVTNFPASQTLPDGTIISLTYDTTSNPQIFTIIAKRPFAVSKIEATKQTTATSGLNKVEIILAIDCTGSMNECADSTIKGDPCPSGTTYGTRIKQAKIAAKAFVEAARNDLNRNKIYIGIEVFRGNARWLKSSYTEGDRSKVKDITPTNNLDSVYTAIDDGFDDEYFSVDDPNDSGKKQINVSEACHDLDQNNKTNVFGSTSIGSGYAFMHDYFAGSVADKKIEILITDGEPNTRIPYAPCPAAPNYDYCPYLNCAYSDTRYHPEIPGNGQKCYKSLCTDPYGYNLNPYYWPTCTYQHGQCIDAAVDFAKCTLADNDASNNIIPGDVYVGARPADIDAYSVTVNALSSSNEVYNIFKDYSTKYYSLNNAAGLTDVLQDIFQAVVTTSIINIRRVTP